MFGCILGVGLFAGSVPTDWLDENGLFKCKKCSQLVAKSHSNSHHQKCTNRDNSSCSADLPSSSGSSSSNAASSLDLFTFEEVLNSSALLSATVRPTFARVLSDALREK